jgi:hypothetical protein
MCVLIGNMVKTRTADYPCRTREEAEALYMALRSGHQPESVREREQREPARRPEPEKVES